MITNDKLNKDTNYFGCQKSCDNLKMQVKLEFDCNYLHNAISFLRDVVDGQTNYELVYNSNDEKVIVYLHPEALKLTPDFIQSVEDLEEIEEVEEVIEEVEDLDDLEEVCFWD